MAEAKPLSPRDRAVLDLLIDGKSETEVAAQFDISQPRVSQIRHSPAATAYLGRRGAALKPFLHNLAGAEIARRFSWGLIRFPDLVALYKATMPNEPQRLIVEQVREEAEKLAAELGLDVAEVLAEAERIMRAAR
jgi:hypothetical protein